MADNPSRFGSGAFAQPDDKAFLVTGQGTLTYGELRNRIRRISALLRQLGVEPGGRVLLAVSDDVHAATLFLALLGNGVVVLLLDPGTGADTARQVIDRAQPDGFIVDAALAEAWGLGASGAWLVRAGESAGTNLLGRLLKGRARSAGRSYPAVLEFLAPADPLDAGGPETPAYVIFTSGSTSLPKGVVISRGALQAHLDTLGRQYGYGEQSRLLNALPLAHADGMVHGPMLAFAYGATLYRPARFSAQTAAAFLGTARSAGVTHVIAVPTMLALLLRYGEGHESDLRHARCVISSAAHLDERLWRAFEQAFGVVVANEYGLTETVIGGIFCGPDPGTRRVGTLGRPVDCELRLVDEKLADVAEGAMGEILMRGAHIMSGYLGDADATAAALVDGWLRTGDLAWRDAEGFYHFAGRRKNIIICGGRNILPEEVAAVLQRHPDVREAAVIGEPDPDFGEVPVACVAAETGAAIDIAGLVAHCRAVLPDYKVPRRVVVVQELPRGASGKVRLEAVRELVAPPEAAVEDENLEAAVLEIAETCFQLPAATLTLEAKPDETRGWDSLGHLQLVAALEQRFGVALTTREILALDSLRSAVRIVAGHRRRAHAGD